MKMNLMRRLGSLLLSCAILANWVFPLFNYNAYMDFLATYFSRDHHIGDPLAVILRLNTVLVTMFVAWLVFTDKAKLMGPTRLSLVSNFNKLAYLSACTILTLYVIGIIFHLNSNVAFYFRGESVLESVATTIALGASVILLSSIRKKRGPGDLLIKSFLSLLLILYVGEEISWGQRIFGWNTPDRWAQMNYQQETNIHNLFNPYERQIAVSFNLILAFLILSSVELRAKIAFFFHLEKYLYLFPSPQLRYYGIGFVILSVVVALIGASGGELSEQLFSVFACAYAMEQLAISRSGLS